MTKPPLRRFFGVLKPTNAALIPIRQNSTSSEKLHIFTIIRYADSALIILLNLIIFSFLVYHKRRPLYRSSTYLFLNLQLGHIIMSSLTYLKLDTDIVIFNNALLLQMFLCMLISNKDRYSVILNPLVWQSKTKIMSLIVASWAFSGSFAAVIIWYFRHRIFILYCCMATILAFSIIVLTILNLRVWLLARRHRSDIIRNMVGSHTLTEQRRRKQLKKSIIGFLMIVATYAIFWTPSLVHILLHLFTDGFYAHVFDPFTFAVEMIAMCNGIIDPIIFVLFNKDVKRALCRKLKC